MTMDTAALFKNTWLPFESTFYKVALYILEDEADARDAVQDLYVKLWNRKEIDRNILNPKAFGITILKNICLDRLRKARSTSTLDEADPAGSPEETDGPVIGKETLEKVGAALGSLPEKMRELLEMRVFRGMPYWKISRETGMSEVNVRVHISKARKLLRKYMENERY